MPVYSYLLESPLILYKYDSEQNEASYNKLMDETSTCKDKKN